MAEETFTLDELRRALHADFYNEGIADEDDPTAEWEHQRAEAMFERLSRRPGHLRTACANPRYFEVAAKKEAM